MKGQRLSRIGPGSNAGTHLVSLSGHVETPGFTSKDGCLKQIIYDLGGGIQGKALKGVIGRCVIAGFDCKRD